MLSEKALEAVFNRVMSASGMPDNDDINYDRWFLEAALTAIAEEGYVIEQGWRPIETAPKDGTQFIAYIQHNVGTATRIAIAWAPAHPEWRYSWWMVPSNVSCPIVETHEDVSDSWLITHWRPLPGPPAIISKAEQGDG